MNFFKSQVQKLRKTTKKEKLSGTQSNGITPHWEVSLTLTVLKIPIKIVFFILFMLGV